MVLCKLCRGNEQELRVSCVPAVEMKMSKSEL